MLCHSLQGQNGDTMYAQPPSQECVYVHFSWQITSVSDARRCDRKKKRHEKAISSSDFCTVSFFLLEGIMSGP